VNRHTPKTQTGRDVETLGDRHPDGWRIAPQPSATEKLVNSSPAGPAERCPAYRRGARRGARSVLEEHSVLKSRRAGAFSIALCYMPGRLVPPLPAGSRLWQGGMTFAGGRAEFPPASLVATRERPHSARGRLEARQVAQVLAEPPDHEMIPYAGSDPSCFFLRGRVDSYARCEFFGVGPDLEIGDLRLTYGVSSEGTC
jgi:hypothetical protein